MLRLSWTLRNRNRPANHTVETGLAPHSSELQSISIAVHTCMDTTHLGPRYCRECGPHLKTRGVTQHEVPAHCCDRMQPLCAVMRCADTHYMKHHHVRAWYMRSTVRRQELSFKKMCVTVHVCAAILTTCAMCLLLSLPPLLAPPWPPAT